MRVPHLPAAEASSELQLGHTAVVGVPRKRKAGHRLAAAVGAAAGVRTAAAGVHTAAAAAGAAEAVRKAAALAEARLPYPRPAHPHARFPWGCLGERHKRTGLGQEHQLAVPRQRQLGDSPAQWALHQAGLAGILGQAARGCPT